ncbi:uncharacterized protein LOC117318260 [Pecten maximus]|uniref:uncharacterized protein LOC117318260 n=1 Tax=Pecten maximus TaxID=6579 RepID=UPI001458660C|nr:uncharacterized protein LOC117318260 [Pecten maximus]
MGTVGHFYSGAGHIPNTPQVSYTTHIDTSTELHIYSDASEKAISAVAYLRSDNAIHQPRYDFVMGKSKVAPRHGHTIPRLELCAAVMAVEIAETLTEELPLPRECVSFHTDSKVVLGYLNNRTHRFFVYVANRVSRILDFSTPEQWRYVSTEENPADQGTRYVRPSQLMTSSWILGPASLKSTLSEHDRSVPEETFPRVTPESDTEVRPEPDVQVTKTLITSESVLGVDRFDKFSTWNSILRSLSFLCRSIHRIRSRITPDSKVKTNDCTIATPSETNQEHFVLKQEQQKYYPREIRCLATGHSIPRDSHVLRLSPFLDGNGLLRVGGRLQRSNLPNDEKRPILIPGSSHIATLLVLHFHQSVHHQCRQFTEGAIRAAGYWITGGKKTCVVGYSSMCHMSTFAWKGM